MARAKDLTPVPSPLSGEGTGVRSFARAMCGWICLAISFLLMYTSGTTAAWATSGPAALQRVLSLVDLASRTRGAAQAMFVAEALAELRADPYVGGNQWLAEPLTARPPDLADARVRLTAAIDGLREPSWTPPSDARARLTRVLADPAFHPRSWLDLLPAFLLPVALILSSIVQLIWSIIRWPFDRLIDLLRIALTSPLFGPAILLAALGVAGGLIALYRIGLRAILVSQAEATSPTNEAPLTAADALAVARERASRAQYRDACHFILLATMLWVEEKGLTRFDRSATNREQVAQLATVGGASDRQLVEALESMIGRFDRVWYGQPFVTDSDYEDLLRLAGRVRDALS